MRSVVNPGDVDELVRWLGDSRRRQVVVVVSTHPSQARIDAAELERMAAGTAEVWTIVNGPLTYRLSDQLHGDLGVYGSAARIYPPGDAWRRNYSLAPLLLLRNYASATDLLEHLTDRLLALAHADDAEAPPPPAPPRPRPRSPRPTRREVEGLVSGIVGPDQALVQLPDGQAAVIDRDQGVLGVALTHLVRSGQRVRGMLDPATGRLDISKYLTDPAAELARYRDGQSTTALVTDVAEDRLRACVHPLAPIWIRTTRAEDYSPGQTIAVRMHHHRGKPPSATLDADDELAPAPVVVPGGPAWIEPGQFIAMARKAPKPAVTVKPTVLDRANQLQILQQAKDELSEELAHLHQQLNTARATIQRLQERQLTRRTKGESAAPEVDYADAFNDPEDQFRFEVYLAWVTRISAAEKSEFPLPDYQIGPRFLDSLDRVEGVSRARVCEVVVDVVTDRAKSIPGRRLHHLRQHDVGGGPPVIREDGAIAWRAAIQVESPSARRLHYWRTPDGGFELSRVVTHDDTDP